MSLRHLLRWASPRIIPGVRDWHVDGRLFLTWSPRQRRQKSFCYFSNNSTRNWHVDGDLLALVFPLKRKGWCSTGAVRFPSAENQGINPVGELRQVESTCTNTKELAPNAMKGLPIPSRLIAKWDLKAESATKKKCKAENMVSSTPGGHIVH